MKTAFFQMDNYTRAVSAKLSLSEYRISSRVDKFAGSGGCGYRLVVFGNTEKARMILLKKGFIKRFPKEKSDD